jgi:nucleotidyltransferase substrate binding protein (TIGR01987 family)
VTLDLAALDNATAALERAVAVVHTTVPERSQDERELLQSGLIQAFEFTYEVAWKMLRRCLADELGASAVEGLARRELFRFAAQHRLIDDVNCWMDFHHARNLTSHTYDAALAAEVAAVAEHFATEARILLERLHERARRDADHGP